MQKTSGPQAQCRNCDAPLAGQYCQDCGQDSKKEVGFFKDMLDAWLNSAFGYESRVRQTVPALLLKPGEVGQDYLNGQRNRHFDPFRLYLFCSLMFFLVHSVFPDSGISVEAVDTTADRGSMLENPRADSDLSATISFDLEEIAMRWLPEAVKRQMKLRTDSVGPIDTQRFLAEFYDSMPKALFALVPVLALVLVILYWKRQHYFAEHMVTALYSHAALFILLTLIVILSALSQAFKIRFQWHNAASITELLSTVLVLWIPLYLFLYHRRTYHDSWLLFTTKFAVTGMLYLFTLVSTILLAIVLNIAKL